MNRAVRYVMWTCYIVGAISLVFAIFAGSARAQEGPMGEPGDKGLWDRVKGTVTNDCLADPPQMQEPASGLSAPFIESPVDPATAQGNWEERGSAGLYSFTFDMGCATTNAPAQLTSTFNTNTANDLVGVGLALTATADFLDRLSWDPSWITGFFSDLAQTLVEAFRLAAFLPYAALGLIFTVLVMLWRSRTGNVSSVALGSAWASMVVVVAVLVMSSPLLLPRLVQSQGGGIVASLYNGQNPSDAATATTVDAIHYQGALRRMFGSDPSDAAVEAFPAIYRSVGYSWAEKEAIRNDPAMRERVWEGKMQTLNEVAADLKETDPTAYRAFTGLGQDRVDPAALELGYSVVANVFRIFAALLRVLCIAVIFILGLAWLFAAPWIMTPQGEGTGRGLLNSTLRAVGYAFISVLGSYGFTTWAGFALAPDVGMGTSILLLAIGTVVFWALIRPDRKLLSLATAGKVQGYGGLTKFLVDKLGTMGAAYLGTREGVEDARTSGAKPTSSEEYDPPVYEGEIVTGPATVYQRGAGLPEAPTVVDGEAWEVYPTAGALPREGSAGPDDVTMPDNEVRYGEVEIYQRPTADAP